MKKLFTLALLSLLAFTQLAEARSSFGGSRSFSSSRSFSRPSYSAPRPVVNRTVIVQQHVTQNHTSSTGGGMGFFGTMIGSGLGSYVGNKLAQPSPTQPVPQPQVAQQFPMCPKIIPVGWNTPCIPQPQ